VPFWYGSNDWIAWGVNAIIFPGLTVVYELSLLIRRKCHPVGIRYLAMPAALFSAVLLWVELQTVTWMPSSLINPIWHMTSNTLHYPIAAAISVNRDLTTLALIRLLTAASAFWLALQLCRRTDRANQLAAAIGTIAALYSAYGLVAMRVGKISWLRAIDPTNHTFSATFINPNSFATYAAIGLVIVGALILRHYSNAMELGAGNWRLQVALFVERTGGHGALLLGAGFVTLVALLLTSSRGGISAAVFGLFVLAVVTVQRKEETKPPVMLLALGGALVMVVLFVFGGSVGVKLENSGVYDANRFAVYLLSFRSILNEPLLGYGYGTFADVFPMYRDRSISVFGTWLQAHDTYLEIFQGLGVVFGTILIACVVILAWRCLRGVAHRRRDSSVPAMAVAATGVVAAHALVDFSLQIQAVSLTFVTLLGAGVAQAASSRHSLTD
jgi:O-antigen ligase